MGTTAAGGEFPFDPGEQIRRQLRTILENYNAGALVQRQVSAMLSLYDPGKQFREQVQNIRRDYEAGWKVQLSELLKSFDPAARVRQQIKEVNWDYTTANPRLQNLLIDQQRSLLATWHAAMRDSVGVERVAFDEVGRALAIGHLPAEFRELAMSDSDCENALDQWVKRNCLKILISECVLILCICWGLTSEVDPSFADKVSKLVDTPTGVIGLVLAFFALRPKK